MRRCDDRGHQQALWRGQDKPTNVLAFPAPPGGGARRAPRHLGDIVIAYETTAAEARGPSASRSTITSPIWRRMAFSTFWATITNRHAQAEAMERRERAYPGTGLGVPDPYAVRGMPTSEP